MDTMRSILRRGAERYLDGEMTMGEWEQGLVMAIAEAPEGEQKQLDLAWLAKLIVEN
jgi:hypothetical protein